MAQFETPAEQEQRHAGERYQLQQRNRRHHELMAEQQRVVDERNRFFSRHGEYIALPGQFLFGDGARWFANGTSCEPPTDRGQRLLFRKTYLKNRLKSWLKDYSEQVAYVRDSLAIQRMGAGPGPGGDWRTALPKFGDMILEVKREIDEITRELHPPSTTPTLRDVNRAQAIADTQTLASFPRF